MMARLLTLASVAAAQRCIYTGSGGCDVADRACQAHPPPPSISKQIVAICDRKPLANVTTSSGGPSWVHLSADGKCLYAVQTASPGRILSFERASLKLVSNTSSGGLNPVKLGEASNAVLVVANYGNATAGASVGSLLIRPGCHVQFADSLPFNRSSIDPHRQLSSHIHTVAVDDGAAQAATAQVIAADLGGDALYTLRVHLQTGKLKLEQTATVVPGSGPRHIAIHPTLRMAYVVSEMSNSVRAYEIARTSGALTPTGPPLSTLPANGSSLPPCTGVDERLQDRPCSKAAEIVVTPDGRSLYASNRGVGSPLLTNTIAGYAVGAHGELTPSAGLVVPSGTVFPRGMALTPDGSALIVAGQGSGNLVAFSTTGAPGTLKRLSELASGLATPTTVAVWDGAAL